MSHEVLPVLLSHVDDAVAALRDAGGAGEVLRIRKQAPPLRLQQVYHVEVLALRLQVRPRRREEMHVGVAAVPALGVHVRPSLEAELQFPLTRLDGDLRSEGFVLETARHVDDDLSSRQPPLAGAVDVGEGRLSESEIATHVVVPRPPGSS